MPLNEQQIKEQCALIKEKGLVNVSISALRTHLPRLTRSTESARRSSCLGSIHPWTTMGSTKPPPGPSSSASSAPQLTWSAPEMVSTRAPRHPSTFAHCSADATVGQVGLLERENAAILNASILTFAQRTIRGFQRAIRALKLDCPLFLTQNDGTLTTAAAAARLPIRTFASGPTNSMRGAAFLAGLDDSAGEAKGERRATIVVDVGGTTSDVGVLLPSGFPRQAASFIEVGGVRTNFAMADVQSIALGGGSIVRSVETPKGPRVTVGPESVGHNITRDAKVFGGSALTASDLIVASGRAELGDKTKVADVSAETVELGMQRIKKLLEAIVDKWVLISFRVFGPACSCYVNQDEDLPGGHHCPSRWRW